MQVCSVAIKFESLFQECPLHHQDLERKQVMGRAWELGKLRLGCGILSSFCSAELKITICNLELIWLAQYVFRYKDGCGRQRSQCCFCQVISFGARGSLFAGTL